MCPNELRSYLPISLKKHFLVTNHSNYVFLNDIFLRVNDTVNPLAGYMRF